MIKRRAFLKGSMATLVALGIEPDLLFGAPQVPGEKASAFGLAWFEARQGSSFRVSSGGSFTEVELVAVQSIDMAPDLEQFHVVFRGAAHAGIQEGLHAVLPEDGVPAAIYLCPTHNGDLSATFCRLRSGVGKSYTAV